MDTNEINYRSRQLKISPVEIIREELEMEILDILSKSPLSDRLIFKGGTCLRLIYGSPRFSVDLDFNAAQKIDIKELKGVLKTITQNRGDLVLKDIYDKRWTLFALLLVAPVGFKQSFSVKIEISKKKYNLKKKDVVYKVAQSPVSPLTPILYAYSLERIFLEKKMAARTRGESRDYFDLWFISQKIGRPLIKLPKSKTNHSQFKGELSQLLPDYLKNWPRDFLEGKI